VLCNASGSAAHPSWCTAPTVAVTNMTGTGSFSTSGNAGNVTGTVAIANGGTGAATAAAHTVFGNFTGSTAAPGFTAAPTFSAANLTNFPTFNQNTTGTAANLTAAAALPGGTAATTQTTGDNTTDLATDAFVNASITANAYSLPQATTSVLGGVKVGTGLSASSGVLSATNYVADVTFSTGTTAVAANSCSPTVGGGGTSVTMTGLTSSMALSVSASSDTSSVTGWGAPASTVLYLVVTPGSGAFTYYVCNNSSSSVTPGSSVTWNVSAR